MCNGFLSKLLHIGVGVVAQWVKPMPASRMAVPAASLLIQLPPNDLEEAADDGPSVWTPATHLGDPDEILGFSLSLPSLSIGAISRSEPADKMSLSLPLSHSVTLK